MPGKRLHVRCPDCDTELVVDAETGELLSHRAAKRPLAGGKDFDSLMRGLDEGKARAEALFEQEKAAMKDRQRLLDEKFEEALRRAEEEPADTPPPRPFDLD
ncbi:MAG TPA: hypothetical protein VGV61_03635 [Thermoanaerobaculia bacterium]|jgi:hypothetical protein|nr:hypothetical protein [Thermoanaerobaculia bacterium]